MGNSASARRARSLPNSPEVQRFDIVTKKTNVYKIYLSFINNYVIQLEHIFIFKVDISSNETNTIFIYLLFIHINKNDS